MFFIWGHLGYKAPKAYHWEGVLTMKLQQALLSRRTIYRYEPKEVPQPILHQAFEAARWAPCHKHTHPWRFYELGSQTREKLLPLTTSLAEEKAKGLSEEQRAKGIQKAIGKIRDAPVLVAVTSAKSLDDPFREKEDYAATVCAMHNWSLSLWAQGVGVQWSTGKITRHEKTYEILGIDLAQEEIIGFFKAGYPAQTPSPAKKPLEEVYFQLD